MRCANCAALGLGDELLARRHRERRELLLQPLRPAHLPGAARQAVPATQYPEFGIHRGRLHRVLYRAARERLGARSRRRPTSSASASSRTSGGVALAFERRAPARRCRRSTADIVIACDGVNSALRRQFYPATARCSPASTPGAASRAAQADPDRPQLSAHRLDPHRQDRDLSDRRRRRRRGQPARSTGSPRSSATRRDERLEQAGRSRRLPAASMRAGASTGSMCRR